MTKQNLDDTIKITESHRGYTIEVKKEGHTHTYSGPEFPEVQSRAMRLIEQSPELTKQYYTVLKKLKQ